MHNKVALLPSHILHRKKSYESPEGHEGQYFHSIKIQYQVSILWALIHFHTYICIDKPHQRLLGSFIIPKLSDFGAFGTVEPITYMELRTRRRNELESVIQYSISSYFRQGYDSAYNLSFKILHS
jgi:hypothetical protein